VDSEAVQRRRWLILSVLIISLAAASRSFVDAMHVTSLISIVIAATGAVAMAIWMPGRRAAGTSEHGQREDGGHVRLGETVPSTAGAEG
jgi:hypothetical protein